MKENKTSIKTAEEINANLIKKAKELADEYSSILTKFNYQLRLKGDDEMDYQTLFEFNSLLKMYDEFKPLPIEAGVTVKKSINTNNLTIENENIICENCKTPTVIMKNNTSKICPDCKKSNFIDIMEEKSGFEKITDEEIKNMAEKWQDEFFCNSPRIGYEHGAKAIRELLKNR